MSVSHAGQLPCSSHRCLITTGRTLCPQLHSPPSSSFGSLRWKLSGPGDLFTFRLSLWSRRILCFFIVCSNTSEQDGGRLFLKSSAVKTKPITNRFSLSPLSISGTSAFAGFLTCSTWRFCVLALEPLWGVFWLLHGPFVLSLLPICSAFLPFEGSTF